MHVLYLQQSFRAGSPRARPPPHPTEASQALCFPDDKVPLEELVANPGISPEVPLSSLSPPAVARLPQVQTSVLSSSFPEVVDWRFPRALTPCYLRYLSRAIAPLNHLSRSEQYPGMV